MWNFLTLEQTQLLGWLWVVWQWVVALLKQWGIPLCVVGLVLPVGCVIRLQDQGEVEVFFGTSVGVKHTASETKADSEATVESQPLVDWLERKEAGGTNVEDETETEAGEDPGGGEAVDEAVVPD